MALVRRMVRAMPRLVLAMAMLTGVAAPSTAQTVDAVIGLWKGGVVDPTGARRCIMVQSSDETATLFLALADGDELQIGLGSLPTWEGIDGRDASVLIDGRPIDPGNLTMADPTTLILTDLPRYTLDDGTTLLIENGLRLDFRDGPFAVHFDLLQAWEAIAEVRRCGRTKGQRVRQNGAPPVQPIPVDVSPLVARYRCVFECTGVTGTDNVSGRDAPIVVNISIAPNSRPVVDGMPIQLPGAKQIQLDGPMRRQLIERCVRTVVQHRRLPNGERPVRIAIPGENVTFFDSGPGGAMTTKRSAICPRTAAPPGAADIEGRRTEQRPKP